MNLNRQRKCPMTKIAIAGKGGSGKTTISGILARIIAQRGRRVWAIDADTNPNLGLTLGLSAERLAEVQPLPRSILKEGVDENGQRKLSLGVEAAEVARTLGTAVSKDLTLLLMGQVGHAGAG